MRFVGTTDFAAGDWIGVEIETAQGKNDGSVKDRQYFTCPPEHGLFIRPRTVLEVLAATEKCPPASTILAGIIPESALQLPRNSTVACGHSERVTETAEQINRDLVADSLEILSAAPPAVSGDDVGHLIVRDRSSRNSLRHVMRHSTSFPVMPVVQVDKDEASPGLLKAELTLQQARTKEISLLRLELEEEEQAQKETAKHFTNLGSELKECQQVILTLVEGLQVNEDTADELRNEMDRRVTQLTGEIKEEELAGAKQVSEQSMLLAKCTSELQAECKERAGVKSELEAAVTESEALVAELKATDAENRVKVVAAEKLESESTSKLEESKMGHENLNAEIQALHLKVNSVSSEHDEAASAYRNLLEKHDSVEVDSRNKLNTLEEDSLSRMEALQASETRLRLEIQSYHDESSLSRSQHEESLEESLRQEKVYADEVSKATAQIHELESTLGETKKDIDRIECSHSSVLINYNKQEEQVQALTKSVEHLSSSLHDAGGHRESTDRQLREHVEMSASCKRELVTMETELADSQEAHKAANTEIDEMRSEWDKEHELQIANESKLDLATFKLEALMQEHKAVQQQCAYLTETLGREENDSRVRRQSHHQDAARMEGELQRLQLEHQADYEVRQVNGAKLEAAASDNFTAMQDKAELRIEALCQALANIEATHATCKEERASMQINLASEQGAQMRMRLLEETCREQACALEHTAAALSHQDEAALATPKPATVINEICAMQREVDLVMTELSNEQRTCLQQKEFLAAARQTLKLEETSLRTAREEAHQFQRSLQEESELQGSKNKDFHSALAATLQATEVSQKALEQELLKEQQRRGKTEQELEVATVTASMKRYEAEFAAQQAATEAEAIKVMEQRARGLEEQLADKRGECGRQALLVKELKENLQAANTECQETLQALEGAKLDIDILDVKFRREQRKRVEQAKEFETAALASSRKDLEVVKAVHEATAETRRAAEAGIEALKAELNREQATVLIQAREMDVLNAELQKRKECLRQISEDLDSLKHMRLAHRCTRSEGGGIFDWLWSSGNVSSTLCCRRPCPVSSGDRQSYEAKMHQKLEKLEVWSTLDKDRTDPINASSPEPKMESI